MPAAVVAAVGGNERSNTFTPGWERSKGNTDEFSSTNDYNASCKKKGDFLVLFFVSRKKRSSGNGKNNTERTTDRRAAYRIVWCNVLMAVVGNLL